MSFVKFKRIESIRIRYSSKPGAFTNNSKCHIYYSPEIHTNRQPKLYIFYTLYVEKNKASIFSSTYFYTLQ